MWFLPEETIRTVTNTKECKRVASTDFYYILLICIFLLEKSNKYDFSFLGFVSAHHAGTGLSGMADLLNKFPEKINHL